MPDEEKHQLTIGELLAFIKQHGLSDDTEICVQREDLGEGAPWFDPCPAALVEISTSGYTSLNLLINLK